MAPCFGGEKEAVEGISMGLPKHILGKMKSLWKGVGAWAEKFITEEMQGECGGAEGTRTVWVSLYQETVSVVAFGVTAWVWTPVLPLPGLCNSGTMTGPL